MSRADSRDKFVKILTEGILRGNPLKELGRRVALRQDMTLGDSIRIMGEEYLGALNVLREIAKIDPVIMLHLDDMNIRGAQIYTAFKDHCGGNLPKFIACASTRDQDMVDFVNKAHPLFKAVRFHGAPK